MDVRVRGVIETSLYVENLTRSLAFYRDLLGLTIAMGPTDRMAALNVRDDQVLLLFKKGVSPERAAIPPHDGAGQLHVAFGISPSRFDDWERRLSAAGVEIESVVVWPAGGRSLYFRDPDGHSLELKTSNWRGEQFP